MEQLISSPNIFHVQGKQFPGAGAFLLLFHGHSAGIRTDCQGRERWCIPTEKSPENNTFVLGLARSRATQTRRRSVLLSGLRLIYEPGPVLHFDKCLGSI